MSVFICSTWFHVGLWFTTRYSYEITMSSCVIYHTITRTSFLHHYTLGTWWFTPGCVFVQGCELYHADISGFCTNIKVWFIYWQCVIMWLYIKYGDDKCGWSLIFLICNNFFYEKVFEKYVCNKLYVQFPQTKMRKKTQVFIWVPYSSKELLPQWWLGINSVLFFLSSQNMPKHYEPYGLLTAKRYYWY